MTITCRQMFQFEYPDSDCDYEIKIGCPCDRNYVANSDHICEVFEYNCTLCWDQPATNPEKLAKIEKDAEKSLGDRIAENLGLEKPDDVELTTVMSREQKDTFEQCIKDSGERREFETGAVRDIQEGKGRCDLMPLDVVGKWLNSDILTVIQDFKTTGDVDFLYGALTYFVVETSWDDQSMILQTAKHFEAGAVKYGDNNWQKGIPVHCYIDSAVRHYLKFLRGDDDEPHDRAFVWNIMCCIWTCIHKPELNDFCEVKEDEDLIALNTSIIQKQQNKINDLESQLEKAYSLLDSIQDTDHPEIEEDIGYLGEALDD